ncbi:MAG: tryptophan dimethylallyltransferase family protein [Myxococcota bacterium]
MKVTQPARLISLLDLGLERLLALGTALDLPERDLRNASRLFERMASGWADASLRSPARWPSDITDDHTPFEFSLAIDRGVPELRFLCEAQGDVPSHSSNWEAAHQLNRELAKEFAIDLQRLARVEDLFAPTKDCPRFSLWHAVCLRAGEAPDFKVYLNPLAQGAQRASASVEEAMTRLGFAEAWKRLPVLEAGDEYLYFSLDLAARPEARLKLYCAHPGATLDRVERAVSTAKGYVPGRASRFCEAVTGSHGPYTGRPLLTCLSFVEGSAQPSAATLHVPVRAYAHSDAEARARVLGAMQGPSAELYATALENFSRRSLADRSGMQTYASLRLGAVSDRVTVYLAPEAYAVPVRQSLRPSRPDLTRATCESA